MSRCTIEIPENIYESLLDTRNHSAEARAFQALFNSTNWASLDRSDPSSVDKQKATALLTALTDQAPRDLRQTSSNQYSFVGPDSLTSEQLQTRLHAAARERGAEAERAPAQRPTDAGVRTGPSTPGTTPRPEVMPIDRLARANNPDIQKTAQSVREQHDRPTGVTAPAGTTPRRATTLGSILKAAVLAFLKDRSVKHAVAAELAGSNNEAMREGGLTAQGDLLMRHLRSQGSQASTVRATGTAATGQHYRDILEPPVESPATARAPTSASANANARSPAP